MTCFHLETLKSVILCSKGVLYFSKPPLCCFLCLREAPHLPCLINETTGQYHRLDYFVLLRPQDFWCSSSRSVACVLPSHGSELISVVHPPGLDNPWRDKIFTSKLPHLAILVFFWIMIHLAFSFPVARSQICIMGPLTKHYTSTVPYEGCARGTFVLVGKL